MKEDDFKNICYNYVWIFIEQEVVEQHFDLA